MSAVLYGQALASTESLSQGNRPLLNVSLHYSAGKGEESLSGAGGGGGLF